MKRFNILNSYTSDSQNISSAWPKNSGKGSFRTVANLQGSTPSTVHLSIIKKYKQTLLCEREHLPGRKKIQVNCKLRTCSSKLYVGDFILLNQFIRVLRGQSFTNVSSMVRTILQGCVTPMREEPSIHENKRSDKVRGRDICCRNYSSCMR